MDRVSATAGVAAAPRTAAAVMAIRWRFIVRVLHLARGPVWGEKALSQDRWIRLPSRPRAGSSTACSRRSTGDAPSRPMHRTARRTAFGKRPALVHGAAMAVILIFILGIGNFALHKAVLESGHPLLGRMPWFVHMLGGRITLVTEFLVLLAAMLL